MPRTRTGLVPTSYRQKVEELSFPWSALPTKPKPTMYRYRGDYVNERNRKLLVKRKLALKEKQSSLDRPNADENESLGSILKITPYGSIDAHAHVELPSNQSSNFTNWDPYYKHSSHHKLSEVEESARARNKSKFVSYLRVEASKRLERKGKERPTDNNAHKLNDVIVRQRKPPVPRLSHLARSREVKATKENHPNGQKQLLRDTKPKLPCQEYQSNDESEHLYAMNTKVKAGYLEFISKKSDNPRELSPERKGEDDETAFSSQIQRIVERAAEMVLNEQTDRRNRHSAIIDNDDHAKSKSSSHRHDTNIGSKFNASDDFFEVQNRKLTILEERVSSMASTVISENGISFISHDTADILDRFYLQRKNNMSIDTTVGTGDLEAIETKRAKIRQMIDVLNSSDSSSSYGTSVLADTYYSHNHGWNSKQLIDAPSTTTCTSTTYCSGQETSTELMPRDHVQPNTTLCPHPNEDPCPIETWPLPAYRAMKPPKESHWEEEPLPRGFERTPQLSKRHVDSWDVMINPNDGDGTCSRNNDSESIANGLFSLL